MMIDDDPTFLTVFSKTLTQKGHQVLTFEKPCHAIEDIQGNPEKYDACLLYTSPSPRDVEESRMPSSA